MARRQRYRAWCFTHQVQLDNDAFEAATPQTHKNFRYMVYQTETAPETGRVHIQGYIEFTGPLELNSVRNLLGGQAHVERRRGTRDEARAYCMKADTRMPGTEPTELGDWNQNERSRTDLTEAKKRIRELGTYRKCLDEDSLDTTTARHPKWVADQLAMVPKTIRQKPVVTVYYGPTNTGKTYTCFSENPGLHTLELNGGFMNYTGQTHVLFDEFDKRPWPFGLMLKLLDVYPLQVNVKNGYCNWEATHIFITSTTPPGEWFLNDKNYQVDFYPQLERRITTVVFTGVPPAPPVVPLPPTPDPNPEHSEHSQEIMDVDSPTAPTVELTVSADEWDEFDVLGAMLNNNTQ